ARIADHLPSRHVTVAAIDRVGEKALHGDLKQRLEKHAAGETRERRLAVLHGLKGCLAVRLGQAVEILAVSLASQWRGGLDAGAEDRARIKRELIPQLGLGLRERPLTVEPRPHAVGSGKLAVDEGRDAAGAAGGRQLVGWNNGVDGGDDEGVL